MFNAHAQTIADLKNISIKDFTKYNYKNGLSNDIVRNIVQDDEGFIWIATENGLNRFDGHAFVNYYTGNTLLRLPSSNISFVRNLGNHFLGICTRKGFVLLNTKTYNATLYRIPDTTAFDIYANSTWGAALLSNNRVAISTAAGFYVFDSTAKIIFRHDAFKPDDLGKKRILYGREIFSLGNDEYILFANENNVAYYNCKTNEYKYDIGNPSFKYKVFSQQYAQFKTRNLIAAKQFLLINKKDTIIYYDHEQKTTTYSALPFSVEKNIDWFAKIQELNDTTFLLNAATGFYTLYLNKATGKVVGDTSKIINDIRCTYYFIDKDKRLWIGTQSGLYVQKISKPSILALQNNPLSTKNVVGFNSCIIRYKDKYYVGKNAKYDSSLMIINATTLQLEKKIVFTQLKDEWREIQSIQQYHNDTLWIGTNGGLVWFNTKNYTYAKYNLPATFAAYNNVPGPILYPIDKYGNAWIVYTMQGVVAKYNIEKRAFSFYTEKTLPSLPFSQVKSIVYDSYNNVWIAGHGLMRYNYASNSFDTAFKSYAGKNKYEENIVVITADNNGYLWFQNVGNDLLKYNIAQKKYSIFNSTDFSNAEIKSFSYPINGNVWVLQPHILSSLNISNNEVYTFKNDDGLPDDIVNSNIIYYDSIANILIAVYNNHIAFIPNAEHNEQANNTAILIPQIVVDSKTTIFNVGEKLVLDYDVQQATIHFTCINFEHPDAYTFFYKLNNDDWIPIIYNRVIQLNNLKPGSYNITIKAIDKSGKTALRKITIEVATPFWQSGWFKLLLFVLIAACILSIVKWREKIQKEAANEKILSQQIKNDSLQQQLEMEQITNYFTSSVADKNNVEDILWDVAGNLIGKLGFEDCIIYLWNKDKTKMIQMAGYGPKGSIEEINKQPFDVLAGQGVVGYVMQTKESLIIEDTSKDARYRPDEAVRFSEICVPIIYNDNLIGVLDSEHQQKNFYTQRHLQIMTTIAALIANKLISIESEAGLQQQKLEVANLNHQLAEFEMKALHTQMNPHFIFNCLGTIKSMILDNQPEQASKYLSKFAKMIRLTLNHSIESFISLDQNNEYIQHYLEIENLRFGNAFAYEIIIDDNINAEEVKIPPMMIQPLVENALWHGLLNKEGYKKLLISYSINNHKLICSIDDNGLGINKTKGTNKTHKSVGIDNIKQRLLLLNEKYKTDSSLTIEDKNDNDTTATGTLAIITLPYILNDLP
jgi:ligand-binding sensor domain-containing protein/putative methionine-R-sulfoxide reductase with GAF domain